ncbi:MAG: YHS domain-containing protein [Bacteroidetes bacterium]|nr:YHS domain-containing protein [Bacteroidota bacterium]MBU2584175.1 YHS domain-containing protein [Bacteroidota bacterium]
MKIKNSFPRDPVCNRKMNKNKAYAKVKHNDRIYYLCCPLCQAQFEKDPERYITKK